MAYHRTGPYTPLIDETSAGAELSSTTTGAANGVSISDRNVVSAVQEVLDSICGDTLRTELSAGHLTAISSPPSPPSTPRLPYGLTASTIADTVYLNHHLSVSDLRRHLEQSFGAGQALSPSDGALVECMLEVAVATERRLATILNNVQDITYGAPELRSMGPTWLEALIRALLRRPT